MVRDPAVAVSGSAWGACVQVNDVAEGGRWQAKEMPLGNLILVDFPPSMSSGSRAQKHEFCVHIERASAFQV